jgi:hypothetical protein
LITDLDNHFDASVDFLEQYVPEDKVLDTNYSIEDSMGLIW